MTKKTTYRFLASMLLSLAFQVAFGQCIFVSITGPRCASEGSVNAVFSRSPFQVEWRFNNTVVQTSTANWGTFTTPVVSGTLSNAPATNKITGAAGLWVDNSGEIYVSDTINQRIVAFSRNFPDGRTVVGANGTGNGGNQLNKPAGLCMDAFGNLFVTDASNHRILRFAPGSTVGFPVAGNNGNGNAANQLSNPRDVWVDANGFLYIADAGNHRIQKWGQGSTTGQTIAGGFGPGKDSLSLNSPQAVFVDQLNRVYVADSGNHRIQRFIQGNLFGTTVAGGNDRGAEAYQLNQPVDVWVDGGGDIYVLDAGNNRVQRWAANRLYILTIAGSKQGFAGSFDDQFNFPSAMAFDPSGNLFVLDNRNLRVQNTPTIQVSNTYLPQFQGQYSATAYSFTGCRQNSNSIFINSNGTIAISGNTNICRGDTTTLKVTGSFGYNWFPQTGVTRVNDSIYRIRVDSSTYFAFSSRNDSGCVSFAGVSIKVSDRIFPFVTATNCEDPASSRLSARLVGGTPAHLLWYNTSAQLATTLPTWSSTGVTIAGGNGIGTSSAQFNLPSGLFVDEKGNTYVADAVNHRIQLYRQGELTGTTIIGGQGAGNRNDQLNYPTGVFVDIQGNVYVADQNNHRIQLFTAGATTGTTVAGMGTPGNNAIQLNFPSAVFVDAYGNVYVADAGNNRIQKWTAGARSVTTIVGSADGIPGEFNNRLNNPQHIFIDKNDNIYVADAGNHRVMFFSKDSTNGFPLAGGRGVGSLQNQLNSPSHVWVDAIGTMYVTDRGNNRIQRWKAFDSTGVTVAGNPEGNAGSLLTQLFLPSAASFTRAGNLVVADTRNHRIQQFSINTLRDTVYNTGTTGSYSALVSSFSGCSTGSAFTQLSVAQKIVVEAASTAICEGGTTSITASGADGYTWEPISGLDRTNVATVRASPIETIKYTVRSTATNGCRSTASVTITVRKNKQPEISGLNCLNGSKLNVAANTTPAVVTWTVPGSAPQILNGVWSRRATIVAGSIIGGFDSAKFARPVFVFVDTKGDLFVSDQWNHRIQKWTPGATAGTTVAGGKGSGNNVNQLRNPSGVFVDAQGVLYIADTDNDRVQRWMPGDTAGVTVAGGNGRGIAANQLNYPTAVFVDAYDNLYIADALNARVQRWEAGAKTGVTVAGGNFAGTNANQLGVVNGLFVDANQNIYIADTQNDRVQLWAKNATTGVTVAGGNGKGNNSNQLISPMSVWVDGNGDMYIAEGGSVHRVKRWQRNRTEGEVIVGGNNAGAGSELLNGVGNAVLDANGQLFVSDINNFRVQRFSIIDSLFAILPSATGLYRATTQSFDGCIANTNPLNMLTGTVPNDPVVADKKYCVNDRTLPLAAGPGRLLWYNTASGGRGDTVAPIPNATIIGTTNYWVSQINSAGTCESRRLRISVSVNPKPGAQLQIANSKSTIFPGDTALLRVRADSGRNVSRVFWHRNGSILNNGADTAQLFRVFYATTGRYFAEVADSNLCSSRSNEIDIIAGLVSGQAMYLFPNPVQQSTKLIYSTLPSNILYVKVVSTTGIEMINKKIPSAVTGANNVYDLDLSKLPTGTYEVQLITGVGRIIGTRRIFKL